MEDFYRFIGQDYPFDRIRNADERRKQVHQFVNRKPNVTYALIGYYGYQKWWGYKKEGDGYGIPRTPRPKMPGVTVLPDSREAARLLAELSFEFHPPEDFHIMDEEMKNLYEIAMDRFNLLFPETEDGKKRRDHTFSKVPSVRKQQQDKITREEMYVFYQVIGYFMFNVFPRSCTVEDNLFRLDDFRPEKMDKLPQSVRDLFGEDIGGWMDHFWSFVTLFERWGERM
jgi:hypothetical protein